MKSVVLILYLSLLSFSFSIAQPGRNNSNFNVFDVQNSDGANDPIEASALQSDGKLIIAGYYLFSSYNGVPVGAIARLDTNGNLDESFKAGSGISGNVFDIAIQPDGKILVAGGFNFYNDTACTNIIRLLPSGIIDKSYQTASGPNSFVNHLALQPDGKIIIAGNFTSFGGVARNRVARLNSDGTLDTSFSPGTGANAEIFALAIQPDGKVLAGGDFTTFAGNSRPRIARLNTNGTVDATFNPVQGANQTVKTIALQPDGKILIGGNFTTYGLNNVSQISRLNSNGTFDPSFTSGLVTNGAPIDCIALDQTGKILIGGYFPDGFARLHSNGSIDESLDVNFGTKDLWDGSGSVKSIILHPDGQIILAGALRYYNGIRRGNICWITANGNLDLGFNQSTGANDTIFTLAPGPNGKILIGGSFTLYNGVPRNGLAQINSDGTADLTFNPTADAEFIVIKSIHRQRDGKVLVGGIFRSSDGSYHPLRRFNMDGTLDFSFDNLIGYSVNSVTTQSDGKIIAGGELSSSPGNLIRLLPNGSSDPFWNVPFGLNGKVFTTSSQADGKIIVGGSFSFYQTAASVFISRNNIVRLNADGTLDLTFDPGNGTDFTVYATVIQPDGKIILGGYFQSYDGVEKNGIVRLNSNGTIDETFLSEPGINSIIRSVVLLPDGKIIIVGDFSTVDGVAINRIARLHPDGTLDHSFDPGAGANNEIYAASYVNDNITIGGIFTSFDGRERNRIAQLLNKSLQTISFDAIPDIVAGSSSFALNASSTAGLPVTFATSDPEISISGNTITPLSPGSVMIAAQQNGNDIYFAASSVQQSFCVNPTQPSITTDLSDPLQITLISSSESNNQWFNNGAPINATSKTFVPTTSGLYTVQVTVEGCKSDFSNEYAFVVTSIESLKKIEVMSAYPNPNSENYITFSFNESLQGRLTVLSVSGIEVLNVNNYKSDMPLFIESLAQGMYLARIETKNQLYWARFIKY